MVNPENEELLLGRVEKVYFMFSNTFDQKKVFCIIFDQHRGRLEMNKLFKKFAIWNHDFTDFGKFTIKILMKQNCRPFFFGKFWIFYPL